MGLSKAAPGFGGLDRKAPGPPHAAIGAGDVGRSILSYLVRYFVALPNGVSIHATVPTETFAGVTFAEDVRPVLHDVQVGARTSQVRLSPESIESSLDMSKRLVLQYVEFINRLKRMVEEAAKMKDKAQEVAP